ncbi:hypothetical protein V6N11_037962 [Hibiscus sabdariffa]|uniref:Uncharacterized protein n=1 Tax=Hibiscus sabdariffa TaxID=183260 RepID=A0ABR2ADJ7_9ROSI
MSLTVNTTWGLRSHSALRLFLSTAIDEEYSSPILKLNPAILYVQGMNEVLAPIHYAFGDSKEYSLHGVVQLLLPPGPCNEKISLPCAMTLKDKHVPMKPQRQEQPLKTPMPNTLAWQALTHHG